MGLIDRILYVANLVAAVLLLLSFIAPYVPPENFSLLSAVSLITSPLLVINLLFVVYWLVRLKKRIWLSSVLLVVAYFHFNGFWRLGGGEADASGEQLKIMSFNVQLFEAYEEEPNPDVNDNLKAFIGQHDPDVFLVQEYYDLEMDAFESFPYRFIHFKENHKLGHAIFSKYPLENKGAFDFTSTTNNSIYADVILPKGPVRVYNLHLQSFRITPSVAALQDRPGKQIRNRISKAFKLQQQQITAILDHSESTGLPIILGGDLNNTAFSYVYRKIAQRFQDGFKEAGSGIGSTFTFDFYPVRIDYIFSDPSFKVLSFETLENPFADHKPVSATLSLE